MSGYLVIFPLVTAALGVVLVTLALLQHRKLDGLRKLKAHRAKDPGFADLLTYAAMVADGVVIGKNGAFTAGWIYKGDDHESSTPEQREHVSYQINHAIRRLGSGWMVHMDAVRRPADPYSDPQRSAFVDPVCAAIDEERRRHFEKLGNMYEGYFVLTVTYMPPLRVEKKLAEMMFDDDQVPPNHREQTMQLIDHFEHECTVIESRLSGVLRLQRLKASAVVTEEGTELMHCDLLRWLQFCVTGINQPVVLPKRPIYLDAILANQEVYTGVIPKIGRKFVQVISIDGFPMESYPGILGALAEQAVEYRWSSRFIFLDGYEAISHLEKFRSRWRQKVRGFFDQAFNLNTGRVNQFAAEMVADADQMLAEIHSGEVGAGYYTSLIVLMHEDRNELDQSVRMLEKSVNNQGFTARVETVNTLDAFLGSLPGHGVENVRRPLLHSMNFADMIPTSSIWTGLDFAPCPMYPAGAPALMHCVTHGATPLRLNLHVRDVGHAFIFGPIGAGKSTHLALLAAQLRRYQNMEIYVFDKGLSMYPLTMAIGKTHGAQHFSVAGDTGGLAFCPGQFLESRADRAWMMEWIASILELNGLAVTAHHRNAIAEAVLNLHNSKSRTLSELVFTIQDETIREALKQYTVDGLMGHLLDADEDGLALSSFTCFEIEDLMNLGEKYALPVLLYLFRRIERSLKGQPTAIILDEAWLMLGHEVFRAKIREWLKVLRKANCLVLMATQSLSDAANSGILDVILEATATKIFLPNVYARDDEASVLYRRMGLNPRQIEILATARPKAEYYYISEQGRRLYDLALGPMALSVVGATDKESLGRIRELASVYGDDWIHEWLEMRGLKLADYVNVEDYAVASEAESEVAA